MSSPIIDNVNKIYHFDMEETVINMTGLEMFAITGYFPNTKNNYIHLNVNSSNQNDLLTTNNLNILKNLTVVLFFKTSSTFSSTSKITPSNLFFFFSYQKCRLTEETGFFLRFTVLWC